MWLVACAVLALRIHDVQGRAYLSPFVGREVEGIEGVVTARVSGAFFLQDPAPDADGATSEAIRVRASSEVAVGDRVRVDGVVRELRAGCDVCTAASDAYANLASTELEASAVVTLARGQPLPTAVRIGPLVGERAPPAVLYETGEPVDVEAGGASLDPARNALDFYESLEAMRVQIDDAVAVGPTAVSGGAIECPVVAHGGFGSAPFTARGGLRRVPGDDNTERIALSNGAGVRPPDLDVGDALVGASIGVLDASSGRFALVLTEPAPPKAAGPEREVPRWPPAAPSEISIATMNTENLGPRSAAKMAELAALLAGPMASPDIVVLQEIQDDNGPLDDGATSAGATYAAFIGAIAEAGGPRYVFRDVAPEDGQDGGQRGANIRVGILVRVDRDVTPVDRGVAGAHTASFARGGASDGAALSLGVSPGRIDPDDPAWAGSRKPLVLELRAGGAPWFVVGVHFNSQIGDAPLLGRLQPPPRPTRAKRVAEAALVARFAKQLLDRDPRARVVVAGDFNDDEGAPPFAELAAAGLEDALAAVPPEQRYTHVFEGNASMLDHVWVSGPLARAVVRSAIVHAHADFAHAASDHDPAIVQFALSIAHEEGSSGVSCALSSRGGGRVAPPVLFAWTGVAGLGALARSRRRRRGRPFLSGRPFFSKKGKMSYPPIACAFLLLTASCLTGGGGPSGATQGSSSPAESKATSGPAASTGSGECGAMSIQNKSQFDGCQKKCRDNQRDQQRSCNDPNCLSGIGGATGACMSKCDEGKKAAQQAKCYKDE